MSDSLQPHQLSSPWNSPGQNTGMSSLSLLQGIFLTHGSNPSLPHCRWILYQLSHKGKEPQSFSKQIQHDCFPTGKELGRRKAVMAPQLIPMCPHVLIPVKQQQCLQISVSCPNIEVTSKDTASRVT